MQSVKQALEVGWEVVLPVQHMSHDFNVILMRHERLDGKLELGFALETKL